MSFDSLKKEIARLKEATITPEEPIHFGLVKEPSGLLKVSGSSNESVCGYCTDEDLIELRKDSGLKFTTVTVRPKVD